MYILQVPIGVSLKNEANLGDICHILNDLSKYVPSVVSNDPEGVQELELFSCYSLETS